MKITSIDPSFFDVEVANIRVVGKPSISEVAKPGTSRHYAQEYVIRTGDERWRVHFCYFDDSHFVRVIGKRYYEMTWNHDVGIPHNKLVFGKRPWTEQDVIDLARLLILKIRKKSAEASILRAAKETIHKTLEENKPFDLNLEQK